MSSTAGRPRFSGTRVILLRHGQTDYNAEGRLQGQVDIPLNTVGTSQAQTAAKVLARFHPSTVYSSDLVRARDTAQALADRVNLPVVLDERLRERHFGAWEGLTRDEIRDGWPDQFDIWRSWGNPTGIGAETRREVGQRVLGAVTEIAEATPEHHTIVVVTHGAAIAAVITAMLGHDPDTWRGVASMENCHFSTLHHRPGHDPSWQLVMHNAAA